jgi:glutathione S-transferase
MGHLLYKHELTRRIVIPRLTRSVFATSARPERDPAQELPGMLDRIDAWVAEGVLNGPQLNAADFMIAPSLALILYRDDVTPMFEGRPALELVDRLLPAPA